MNLGDQERLTRKMDLTPMGMRADQEVEGGDFPDLVRVEVGRSSGRHRIPNQPLIAFPHYHLHPPPPIRLPTALGPDPPNMLFLRIRHSDSMYNRKGHGTQEPNRLSFLFSLPFSFLSARFLRVQDYGQSTDDLPTKNRSEIFTLFYRTNSFDVDFTMHHTHLSLVMLMNTKSALTREEVK